MAMNENKQTASKGHDKGYASCSRGQRKLTNEQVEAIVKRYRAGEAFQHDLGKEYGVTAQAISAIFRGISYSWLTRIGIDAAPTKISRAA